MQYLHLLWRFYPRPPICQTKTTANPPKPSYSLHCKTLALYPQASLLFSDTRHLMLRPVGKAHLKCWSVYIYCSYREKKCRSNVWIRTGEAQIHLCSFDEQNLWFGCGLCTYVCRYVYRQIAYKAFLNIAYSQLHMCTRMYLLYCTSTAVNTGNEGRGTIMPIYLCVLMYKNN